MQTNDSAVTLLNSNAIFVAPKVSVRREYITILYKVYLTEVRVVNFHEPVPTADLINTWVRDNTKGLINTLVEPGKFDYSLITLNIKLLRNYYYVCLVMNVPNCFAFCGLKIFEFVHISLMNTNN